jgi:hypothetical protein
MTPQPDGRLERQLGFGLLTQLQPRKTCHDRSLQAAGRHLALAQGQ